MISLELEAKIILELVKKNTLKVRVLSNHPGLGWVESDKLAEVYQLIPGDTVVLSGATLKFTHLDITQVPTPHV